MNTKVLFVCNDPRKKENAIITEHILKALSKFGKLSASTTPSKYNMIDTDIMIREDEQLSNIVKGDLCDKDVSYTDSPYDAIIYHSCKQYGDDYIKLFDPECVTTITNLLSSNGIFAINGTTTDEYNMAIKMAENGDTVNDMITDLFNTPFDVKYDDGKNITVWIKK